MKFPLSFLLLLVFHTAWSQDCFLVVSSGGGFAGVATAYKITPDGKVLKAKGLGPMDYSEQALIKKSVARKYYRKTASLTASSPEFNFPGNIYYSIRTVEKDKDHKITWGDAGHEPSLETKELYGKIMKKISALTFTTVTTK